MQYINLINTRFTS